MYIIKDYLKAYLRSLPQTVWGYFVNLLKKFYYFYINDMIKYHN